MPKQKLPKIDFEWTPQLAYAVGLLTTDGNLSNDGRHINLRSSEADLLNTFRICLGINNKIGSIVNQEGYRIQFGNVQFYNWLMRIGLTPAKTHTLGIIKVPDIYFADFLRGHLDGDGNIRFYNDQYNIYRGRVYNNIRLFVRFISASKSHILWLRKKINELTGLRGALIREKPANENHVPIWEIKYAKHESLKLLDWIYYKENLPKLERKYRIAQGAIKAITNKKRKKYEKLLTAPLD